MRFDPFRKAVVVAAALALALGSAPPAGAGEPGAGSSRDGFLDTPAANLGTYAHVLADGAQHGDYTGSSVAVAPDMDGNGLPELIVAAHSAGNNDRPTSGSVYVIFNGPLPPYVGLRALGSRGFRIDGASPGDYAGRSVAAAGDVNGDGRGDLVVGAPNHDGPAGADSGSAYVIFGKDDSQPVDLADLGDHGFEITGAAPGDHTGQSVAGVGDLNDDGLAEVLVGAPEADPGGRNDAGAAYVVTGSGSPAAVHLSGLSSRGFRISGAAPGDKTGFSVARAGAFQSSEGRDLIIGAPWADASGRSNAGSAYVIHVDTVLNDLDLSHSGDVSMRIDGAVAGNQTGYSVAGAGDINGDQLSDVAVGSPFASPELRLNAGSVYVIFAPSPGGALSCPQPCTIDLAQAGSSQVWRIDGAAAGDVTGVAITGVADITGDHRAELLIGAPYVFPQSRHFGGVAYLVHSEAPSPLDLANPGDSINVLLGASARDMAGLAVASADLNGGGSPDLIVGAPLAGCAITNSGAAYVVYTEDGSGGGIDCTTGGGGSGGGGGGGGGMPIGPGGVHVGDGGCTLGGTIGSDPEPNPHCPHDPVNHGPVIIDP